MCRLQFRWTGRFHTVKGRRQPWAGRAALPPETVWKTIFFTFAMKNSHILRLGNEIQQSSLITSQPPTNKKTLSTAQTVDTPFRAEQKLFSNFAYLALFQKNSEIQKGFRMRNFRLLRISDSYTVNKFCTQLRGQSMLYSPHRGLSNKQRGAGGANLICQSFFFSFSVFLPHQFFLTDSFLGTFPFIFRKKNEVKGLDKFCRFVVLNCFHAK